ncbi:DUF3530 family protein [Alteromonas sp.]|uniref:DUF3530 family protein n=1 Tax=Alteromonas sp. TaxID=232 RepID=UPI000B7502FA|nr:DUF3530 family protein [Alteromonas sp.]MAI38670.1 hypothetical protein [Alteromonas sp.]OUX85502.1 MAG: hypothetical protein CBB95_13745 [Alteromonas sp. TMED35]|tara:strand:+ start:9878 stop:10861 length:984 start_codon:yes stop_codon:yes gene_type:complete
MRKCIASLLCLLALGFSPKAAFGDYFTDISHGFALGEVQELLVGERVVPIIEVESQTPLSQGIAIILVEPFLSSFSLSQSKELAGYLSEKGWRVVISPFNLNMLPTKSGIESANTSGQGADDQGGNNQGTGNQSTGNQSTDAQAAADPSAAEQAPASSGQSSSVIHPRSTNLTQYFDFEQTSDKLTEQLIALNNRLQNVQGYRLIVAQGMLAATFLDATSNDVAFEPDSLVTISPYWPQADVNKSISDLVANSSFPVLDLSIDGLSDWEHSTVVMRRNRAKTSLKLHYRQVLLPSSNSVFSLNQNQKTPYIQLVANNTIGWTRYLGW